MAAETINAPLRRERETASHSQAPTMSDFSFSGCRPLPSLTNDGARDMAEQAAALVAVIAAGWENEDNHEGCRDSLSSLNPRLHVEALEGVRTLIALSAYCLSQVRS